VIDNVGAAAHATGFICNRGIGEIDIGQYDRLGVHPVAGLCFAAALLRRNVFETVGLLESSYFMYAEDSEWCLRAKAYGFTFLAVPQAEVLHDHSLSTRRQAGDVKHWLISRNTLLTAAALLPATTAAAFLLRVMREEGQAAVRDGGGPRFVRHMLDLVRQAPRTALRRLRLRRVVRANGTAAAVLAWEADCVAHNDIGEDGRIVPRVDRSTLIAMYSRRGGELDHRVVRLLEQEPTETLALSIGPLIEADGHEVVGLLNAVVAAEQGNRPGNA
jgi:hypothetical protein